MKIEKIIKKNSNQYKLILSDGNSLSFYDDVIINNNLIMDKNLDKKKIDKLAKENNLYKAYYEALKLIKAKLRTKKEINNLLLKKEYNHEEINFVINKLSKQGYINEEMYIKCFISDAYNLKNIGPNKIKYELKKLGLSEENINNELDNYQDMWQEKIENIVKKEIKINHTYSNKVLESKIKTKLITKGFNKEDIKKYVVINNDKENEILINIFNKELNKIAKKNKGNELKQKLRSKLYGKGFSLQEIDKIISEKDL